MRLSQFPLSTLKETPADAEVISHQLMLRAGMLRKQAAGIYTWLPLGLRVLRKVEHIVREEMDRAGALELLMPAVQPAELWQESGRWEQYGPELLRFHDRHQREFCFGPTHEEVITDIARREIRSYKQLPVNYYQIQTKFRDEIRPRFGVMRAREFLMKDAYSFHTDQASLEDTYRIMYETYSRIFTRTGLEYRAVRADSGAIGGSLSQEFHVLADSGEDAIAFSTGSDFAGNVETVEAPAPGDAQAAPGADMQAVDTPGKHSIEELCDFLAVTADRCLKTLIVSGSEADVVNEDGKHLTGVNWGRDLPEAEVVDLRNVVAGDPSPDGQGELVIARGIEVGHIFQLGRKYSEAMQATVLDEQGKEITMVMGCYGIGVSRIVAAAVEQNHDDSGIIWPDAIAPFQVALLPMNMKKSQRVREAVEALYADMTAAGIDVLLDDRAVRPGVMFSDMELIGIPHRVVVGEKNLDQELLEYKARRGGDSRDVPRSEIISFLQGKLA